MVFETLKYKALSTVLELEQVILEPEITQIHQPFLVAEIADSQLIAETFYRLHRITKIKTGRIPGHETRVRYRYDPIVTVENDFVDFETFSLDMCFYAKARFFEGAFKNVEHWDQGVTNVDFSKSFISQIRGARELRNVFIDPEGIEVLSENESIIEKKIPLPENWRTGLETIQNYLGKFEDRSKKSPRRDVLSRIPFNPYLRKFAKVTKTWRKSSGWDFIEMEMRNQLGKLQVVLTSNQMERMDGRKNINYQAIRANRNLRKIKSYYLDVQRNGENSFIVSGGREPHLVERRNGRYVCDCGDYVHRRNRNCKHIRAINRPKLIVVQESENSWMVTDGSRDYQLKLKGNNFLCECPEFKRTNICQHLVEVLRFLEDYQYDEVKHDLSG